MSRARKPDTLQCGVCHRHLPRRQLVGVDWVRPSLARGLDEAHPGWRDTGHICVADLQAFRRETLEQMIRAERGALTALDRGVVETLARDGTVSSDTEEAYTDKITFGDRLADRMARFAGSWTFIVSFLVILAVWMAVNALPEAGAPFDPYPFILLNLILSCVAALQAPLIMMSQRRVEAKDRLRARNDYQVNLKAELEIRHLHEKIDHHLLKQWERLAEIQDIQLEIMETLSRGKG
ncbi:DUF1003 domain-containing protein [Arsenicitalea aurantiaca]|uniref:DUF1003 domain-containing protein n=1 Tax=Arsenicitalea aurantiaca TaxID=1783274 RepID=A0A433XBB6_9HYPH|nr:DUF1003 domain-containing protein [Arsenicitalea aurantiaca]RUT31391.1 DUF1003 domain-containing protein [Arsenicitalea aurantiaca]